MPIYPETPFGPFPFFCYFWSMRGILQLLTIGCALWSLYLPASAQIKAVWPQYLFNHQSVNPAYTAINEQIGFYLHSRNQWAGPSPAPSMQEISFHTPVFNNFIGTGADLCHEKTDSTSRLSLFTDYSFEMMMDEDVRIRLGANFGIVNSRIAKADPNLVVNFGIGAFIYSDNGYFSLAIPRLMRNNNAGGNPMEALSQENRQFIFSAGAVFRLNETTRIKPVLFYSIPYGYPSRMDLSLHLLLQEQIWLGILWSPDDRVGLYARKTVKSHFSVGVGADFYTHPLTGKTAGNFDLFVTRDIDFYNRAKPRKLYF